MGANERPVYVTQPNLPSMDEFVVLLEDIWESKWLTNNGKYHRQLEEALAEYLGVKYISLFANGTLALIVALQVLHISGEVITTPYSFVATTHALWWNGIKPVFVDIEPEYCNLDPEKVEAAITPKTTAILPVHVYGNPVEVEKIQQIADIYGLKVIYDAAHSFGVKVHGTDIVNYGDLSILSFHATKPYNTIEGGAIICHDEKTKKRIDYLKNFGFAGETKVIAPGINAKMNEIQAAFGLLQLKNYEKQIEERRKIVRKYRELIKGKEGIRFLEDIPGVKHNYAYFPIFVDASKYGVSRDKLYDELKKRNIYGRRYFYPLISKFSPYHALDSAKDENIPVANRIAEEVICLPIYPGLLPGDLERVVSVIMNQ